MSEPVQFPLAAVVGAEALKLALCLTAIDPKIGGVLIEGPRGMAKSTLARGLADLLGGGPFVTLPLGASEERLVGTLDLDAALGQGQARFAPGVLAHADGGVLYVDEVNLLPDALVDLLLDVAASGINRVERDGISHQHAARFVLIGTMNPEEGELRPQLLDRFGLNVALDGLPAPQARQQIIRRRLAFDSDPQAFCAEWAGAQAQLRERCHGARQRLASIPLDEQALAWITERCYAAGVDGLRADLVWLRAARAHAAWRGSPVIEEEDVEAVAEFALRHRRSAQAPQPQAAPPAGGEQGQQREQQDQGQGSWGAIAPQPVATGARREVPNWAKKALSIHPQQAQAVDARPGKGQAQGASRGRPHSAGQGRVAWLATLLKGRPRQRRDLCWQQRKAQAPELWLVIVDASASTRRHQALAQAKGLLAGLFDQAYRQRARLALLTASGDKPRWQRHGLKASATLQPWLQGLGAGGGTPLFAALDEARQWLLARGKQLPHEVQRCLVLTDGRLTQWRATQPLPCNTLVVDMELAAVRLGRARQLAEQLQAEYRHISQFSQTH